MNILVRQSLSFHKVNETGPFAEMNKNCLFSSLYYLYIVLSLEATTN